MEIFHSVSIFKRFIPLVIVFSITCVYQITCVMTFNSCLLYNLFGVPYKCYLGKNFGYYKRFLLSGMILFNLCLMCDQLVITCKCFTYFNILYVSYLSETGHLCIRLFLPAKTLFKLVQSLLLYLMRVSYGLMS